MPRRRLPWRTLAAAMVTLVILGVVYRRFGVSQDLLRVALHARASWLAVALGAIALCTAVTAERWRLVLGGMGHAVRWSRALAAVLATAPLATITPTRTNDLLRPLALREVPLEVGAASVVAEKVVDLAVLLLLAACGALLARMWLVGSALAAMLCAMVGAVWLALSGRMAWFSALPLKRGWAERIERGARALELLKGKPGRLVAVATASLTIRLLTVVVGQALLVAVGSDVRWWQTLAVWPTAILVSLLPVTLGGAGTRDAAFLWLLSTSGVTVDADSVLAATLGYWVLAFAVPALVGLPFMMRAAVTASVRSPSGNV
ncbi:MAG TPA: lysylphosphatidylglycerol synthase transmembrane domain-containing protein [Polyangiaceae bacterium]|jgi:hypothetical protein